MVDAGRCVLAPRGAHRRMERQHAPRKRTYQRVLWAKDAAVRHVIAVSGTGAMTALAFKTDIAPCPPGDGYPTLKL